MNIPITRHELEIRQGELLGRLRHLTEDVRHTHGLEADSEERATQLQNDEVLAGLDSATRVEIEQIRGALARIAAGRYGTCEACGKAIPAKRLEALPYTTRCVRCASTTRRTERNQS